MEIMRGAGYCRAAERNTSPSDGRFPKQVLQYATMRYDNVIRFLGVAFVIGALSGLIGGLIFGGSDSDSAQAASEQDTTETTVVQAMTPEQAAAVGANEMGQIPVLEYHKIGTPEAEWTRTPENFGQDIAKLKESGFYPINLSDMVERNIDVPAGKTPVVLTFDDSSPGQFHLNDDGSIDPQSGIGILNAATEAGDWAQKATFFLLLDVQPDNNVVFGQPDMKQEKVQQLVEMGYEVGSHTISHLNLKEAYTEDAVKQLALSKGEIEAMAGGGYRVSSLSVPFGEYPADDGIFAGEYEGAKYTYTAAVEVTGGVSLSPFSTDFKALHIPRIIVRGDALDQMISNFESNPSLRYISDGDPAAVSLPKELAGDLGQPAGDLGRPTITY